ncbi:MAG TPA: mechanosensitive ion channel domain-containing protein, partial [Gammaproteobacteria bacterium]|nr:mechanosensitive ion channel domain-containing protein [Gammaproteobacteria bacterium]
QADAVLAVRRVLFYTLVIIVAITALGLLHVPLTAFAFVSGAIAIGVGFGAQNIVNNFISGWILMSERPVKIGDFVEVEGSQGLIEVIGNRSTRIRRVDGVHMLVPNSLMLERTVINWTLIDKQIRSTLRVGVAYGSPVREVERLVYQAIGEHASVKPEPAPLVIFEDFGDSALIFDVFFWCDVNGERQLRQVRSDIRFRLCELFAAHGITIAFPQRDVHLDTQRPLQVELVDRTDTAVAGPAKAPVASADAFDHP